jgi:ppGpp synthetase/RelA/SpoT-type nucleotidyltranferase
MPLSNAQVDKLGDRLRAGDLSDNDRELLLEFRASFLSAQREVLEKVQGAGIIPTGRPEKTPESIIDKLRRGTIRRLSEMQDIAGCRIVVRSRIEQDQVTQALQQLFPEGRVTDRRQKPSYGYRAVHLIVRTQGRSAEIQVRTVLQDRWANVVERMSDQTGVDFKHGADSPQEHLAQWLKLVGDCIDRVEREEPADTLADMKGKELFDFSRGQFSAIWSLVPYIRELSEEIE